MSSQGSIEQIKEKHNQLYEKAVKDSKILVKNELERDFFIKEVEDLLKDIREYAEKVSTVNDYRWLSEAVINWQVVLVSTLNIPIVIDTLPPPHPKRLLPPLPRDIALTEGELNTWHSRFAEILGLSRLVQLGRHSSGAEMEWDWYNAQVYLASDILDGFPNFASRIGPASYWRLEEVWVKSVKRLRAYFIWKMRGGGIDPILEENDYYNACEQIRKMLVNKEIKARLEEFGEAKAYLESRILSNGKINRNKSATEMLISRKAERIWRVTGETNPDKNWFNAQTYVRMFYESIIPAVLEKDDEKILTVLKAFQYSKAPENGWWIINCFEVALAIYFLDSDIIKKLWDKSEKSPVPESSTESMVDVQSWPVGFEIPEACKDSFQFDGQAIIFRGVMTESQKKALLAKLREAKHYEAVEELFSQSRLIHYKTTL